MLCKAAIALLIFAAFACGIEDCGSKGASNVSVKVKGCENTPRCTLHRKSNASIEISFTSNIASDTLKAVVHGVVLGVPFPFDLPNPDGCKDCGITCPLAEGQTYNYETSLPVLASYPKVTVDVKWELQDKDGNDVVCVIIPSKIK